MKYILFVWLAIMHAAVLRGQSSFKALIKDEATKEIIVGATVRITGTKTGAVSDENGLIFLQNVPPGRQILVYHFFGYEDLHDTVFFPVNQSAPKEIFLHPVENETGTVVISTTRGTRTIQNNPTRVEYISLEEIDEKVNMKPGDIKMLLSESTGIQTQQTSATTANASIRIQGMDGRYTQILKDGYPLYSGFSGGLSIMQIPPLDLRAVEIIKGSASTLYGGGAIAGLVNLISKLPQEKPELSFLVNGTTAGGLDISGFYSKKLKHTGFTIFGSRNSNTPYAPGNTTYTAIPEFERYTLNPRLFVYLADKTTLHFGLNGSMEDRTGGAIQYLEGKGDSAHSYFDNNKTLRISTEAGFEHQWNDSLKLVFKNSFSDYSRQIHTPFWDFSGNQFSSFTELSALYVTRKTEWIGGLNLYTDKFKEDRDSSALKRDYTQNTIGAFIQGTWNLAAWCALETGLREDYVMEYGFYTLPRVSVLFTLLPNLTSRIGGGLGYKVPSMFTEQAEAVQFRNVMPIDKNQVKSETSAGGSFDINYRTHFMDDKIAFSVNQMFFYTKLDNPLLLIAETNDISRIMNANGYMDTKGIETNIKTGYHDFNLYLGYTFTDAHQHFNNTVADYPLTPKHRVNAVLMYEIEKKWRIGLESYYFSPQLLSDGSKGRDYWLCGFMAEKSWQKFSVFINLENMLDIRQTKFGAIYTGTMTNPSFKDIYAPLDGFVMNGGLKLRL